MTEHIGLTRLALQERSPKLTLSLGPGQSMAVVGPTRAGKSRLLRVIAGLEAVAEGEVVRSKVVALAQAGSLSRRIRPQSIAQRNQVGRRMRPTEALVHLRLSECLNEPLGSLSDSQVAACELLEVLCSEADTLAIDGQLDRLDPLALAGFHRCFRDVLAAGASFVVATQRPDLAHWFDTLVVLSRSQIRFAGSLEDVLRQGRQHRVEVVTQNKVGARATVQPFSIRVEETPNGFVFTAEEGQALAARLLLEGYGDVEMVVIQPPRLEEILVELMG
ncbi:MAG: ATP-binding cassette domain-containing protein [Fimbriimonas sp.]